MATRPSRCYGLKLGVQNGHKAAQSKRAHLVAAGKASWWKPYRTLAQALEKAGL